MVKVISFGHRIPQAVKEQLREKLKNVRFYEVRFHLEMHRPLMPQIHDIVMPIIDGDDSPPFVILPDTSVSSGLLMALMYGYFGFFPYVVELNRNQVRRWEWGLKEIHDLDAIKTRTRNDRMSPKCNGKSSPGVIVS